MSLNRWIAGFDVVRRLDDGAGTLVPLAGETIKIRSITGSFLYSLPVSDSNGFVDFKNISIGTEDQEVELYSDTYSGTCRQFLGATVQDAAINNRIHTFIVDDLNTETTEPEFADVYIQENGLTPRYLGSSKIGKSLIVPYESAFNRTNFLYALGKDATGRVKSHDFRNFIAYSFTEFSASGGGEDLRSLLFSFANNSLSTESGRNLYAGNIIGNTFNEDKVVVRACFKGEFASNSNQKVVSIYLSTLLLFSDSVEQNGGSWRIDIEITRYSPTKAKSHVEFRFHTSTGYIASNYEDDLTIDPNSILILRLFSSSDADGDFIAKSGQAERLGAPVDYVEYLYDDDYIVLTGDSDGDFLEE